MELKFAILELTCTEVRGYTVSKKSFNEFMYPPPD